MIGAVRSALTLHAVLPHPPGINASYRSAGNRWYKTAAARQWESDSLLLLRAAGARRQLPGPYWIGVDLSLYTVRLDIDAPLKPALDVLADVLGVDDRWLGHLSVTKYLVRPSEQRLELVARVELLPDRATFNRRSARQAVETPNSCVILRQAP